VGVFSYQANPYPIAPDVLCRQSSSFLIAGAALV